MRKFLSEYRFEINDLRALITVANVICVMAFGLTISWLGLALAVFGLINDIFVAKRLNNALIHFSNIILNLYFLSLLY